MGQHFNRGARDDGAQGPLQTRALRRQEILDDSRALSAVLDDAELAAARALARGATREIMASLIEDALDAEKASERISAAKLVYAVAWGASLVKPAAGSEPKGPAMITVNVLGATGERPAEVHVIDVGAKPPELGP